MIVGFTITDLNGNRQAAIDYIRKVCIIEDQTIPENIVDAGRGVNIYSNVIDLTELMSQPFSATPIETQAGKHLLISIVNFNLELKYNEDILRLVPTEFVFITPQEVAQFKLPIRQGLVRVIPEVVLEDGVKWILHDGYWDDEGIWVDPDFWRDYDANH